MKYAALFASISTSEKMASLPNDSARLFFETLLPQCDSWGRIESNPSVLCAKVWPMWGKTAADTLAARDACASIGLIELHSLRDRSWIQVPGWDVWAGRLGRRDRRGESEWPHPDDNSRIAPGVVREWSGSLPLRVEEKRGEETDTSGVPSVSLASGEARPKKNGHAVQKVQTEAVQFTEWWMAAFLNATGNEYAFEGAKDGGHVKALLGYVKGDIGLLETRAMALLTSQDPFYAEKGVNLSTLRCCWNKLGSAGRPSRGQPTFESAFEANVRDMQNRLRQDGTLTVNGSVQPRKEIAQ